MPGRHRHRAVPNHFRSLRSPSHSPSASPRNEAAWAKPSHAVGKVPDFSTQPRRRPATTAAAANHPANAARVPPPASGQRSAQSTGTVSPASVIDNFIASAAEARIARHAQLLAERKVAERAATARQRRNVAEAREQAVADAAALLARRTMSRRPELSIDTSAHHNLRFRSPSSSPVAMSATSPLGSTSVSPQNGSPRSKHNDGSQRYHSPRADVYRAVLAQEHTELYSWLSERQNFWDKRGL